MGDMENKRRRRLKNCRASAEYRIISEAIDCILESAPHLDFADVLVQLGHLDQKLLADWRLSGGSEEESTLEELVQLSSLRVGQLLNVLRFVATDRKMKRIPPESDAPKLRFCSPATGNRARRWRAQYTRPLGPPIYCKTEAQLRNTAIIGGTPEADRPNDPLPQFPNVKIYTDGSALKNPGHGGFATVLLYGKARKELSGGFEKTTNNRMEILAAIEGLCALKKPCHVTIYSDSQYFVNAMTKGWVKSWRRRDWRKADGEPAMNIDLWIRLLEAAAPHQVNYVWVRGHNGNRENERCDSLARKAASRANLPKDEGFRWA
jgi:ribonuclease HI